MKFALVDGVKTEPIKGSIGQCPFCKSDVIAKCGNIKVHHWAHKADRDCDRWWENETEWHREWKNLFPSEWQEVIHFDNNGEKHIADVKTDKGWVVEFQHSYLNPEERQVRNQFYNKILWVVDGLRRKRDLKQFMALKEECRIINDKNSLVEFHYLCECRLVEEWHNEHAPVFFDFQLPAIWLLFPKYEYDRAFLVPFSKDEIVCKLLDNTFESYLLEMKSKLIAYQRPWVCNPNF